MKNILAFFFLSIAVRCFAEDFTTTDGKKFEGVTVTRIEADGIVVTTDSGIAKLFFTNLPEDVQKKYGFDPVKAAQVQQQMRIDAVARRVRDEPTMRAKETAQRAAQFGLDLSKPLPDVSGPGKLGGFLGMPWGTPPDIANKVMLARAGTTLNTKESTASDLYYMGGSFSDQEVKFIALAFVDGGLCQATVIFKSTGSDEGVFGDLKTALDKKYSRDRATGNLSLGLMTWGFPSYEQPREEVVLHLSGSVTLIYSHRALAAKAEQIRKGKIGIKDL